MTAPLTEEELAELERQAEVAGRLLGGDGPWQLLVDSDQLARLLAELRALRAENERLGRELVDVIKVAGKKGGLPR